MKRILALFLLLLMLIVGAQPTMSMYFCGKNLQSVNILNEQKEDACCKMHHHQKEVNHNQPNIYQKGCCTSNQVQLSTDDYQYQQQQTLQHSIFHAIDLMWSAIPVSIQSLDQVSVTQPRKNFPPEGLTHTGRDILTSISILRI